MLLCAWSRTPRRTFHLVLPPKPTGALSEEALDHVAAGACYRGQSEVLHCSKDDGVTGHYNGGQS